MEIVLTILLAVTAFLATNIDDLFIIVVFFTRKDVTKTSVVIGQYIGILVLITISILSIIFKFIIPSTYIAFLGLIPIFLGMRKLWNLIQGSNEDEKTIIKTKLNSDENSKTTNSNTLQVSAITFANGGDNLGVYIPLFLSMETLQVGLTCLIFMVMTGFWCILGYFMVNNNVVGNKLESYGHWIFPWVLILIGVGILLGSGTIFSL